MTDSVIEPSDEKLLDAERAEPGLLDRLKITASAAYYQARKHDEEGPAAADQVWNDLHRTWHHNNLVSVTANPNSPADQGARADNLRSTQRAIEYFNGVIGKGLKKPAPAVPTALAAQRLFGIHNSALEAAVAAMPASAEQPEAGGRMSFTPAKSNTKFAIPPLPNRKSRPLVSNGSR